MTSQGKNIKVNDAMLAAIVAEIHNRAEKAPPGFYTLEDWQKRWKCKSSCAKRYLNEGIRLGPVAMVHGYAHGENNATIKQGLHYAVAGGALIHGHTHTLASIALTKHGSGNAFSAGCLCLKDEMGYASHRLATARWGSGWVAGWVDGNNWKAWLVHKVGDQFVWQKDLRFYTPRK